MAAASTASRLISALVITKISALYVGPVGFAAIGQFQNFTAIVLNVGGHCYGNGIVRRMVEAEGEAAVLKIVIRTALILVLGTSTVAAILVFVARSAISNWIFGGTLGPMILAFAVCVVPLNLHYAFLAMTNGLKKSHLFATINLVAGALTVGIGAIVIPHYGLSGALLTPLVANAFAGLVGFKLLQLTVTLKVGWPLANMDRATSRQLIRDGLTALGAMLIAPISLMAIRTILIARGMAVEAGYWQAMMKLADAYMMPLGMLLTMHYLPAFIAARHDAKLIGRMMQIGALQVAGGMLVIAGAMYVYRDVIIDLLLSHGFTPIRDLFLPQTLGDVFRGSAMIFQYALLARGMTRRFLLSEVMFWFVFMGSLAIGLRHSHDAVMVTYAYLAAAVVMAIGCSRLALVKS